MQIRNSLAVLLSVILAAGLVQPANAADEAATVASAPVAAISWTCWSRTTRIVCELEPDAANEGGPPPAATTEELAPSTIPLQDGRSRQLPPIVKLLRERPEQLAGRRITIPTHSQPRDQLVAQELASNVVCSVRPDCRVTFLKSLPEVVLYLDQRSDPALR